MAKSKTEKKMINMKALIHENSRVQVVRPIQQKVDSFKINASWRSGITNITFWTVLDIVGHVMDAIKDNVHTKHLI
jgi:hypothetical protein